MTETGRDRLRELLDAVLDEDHRTLGDMAGGAYASPYHFSRQLSRGTGEPPVAMRRRVMLERAAWQLRQGSSVTDAAFAAGYESVEGFGRAFQRAYGESPGSVPRGPGQHWLPAPNGIHFHPPTSLWIEGTGAAAQPAAGTVTALMVEHDLDDTRELLELAKGAEVTAELLGLLTDLVGSKEVWLAAIEGHDQPSMAGGDVPALLERYDAVAPRWLAMVRDVDRRGAWGDRLVDALCDPPESFVLGSVLAHVLTYAAHGRLQARRLLGSEWPAGDPIMWLRQRSGGDQ
ncbi:MULTISPECIES: helix-turn-helix domain-containing protein [unclassified Nocardioides]|uniref:helix-turn-helix domain-containing protein n=1 Tax=unclassified Nocardioides TaxID=2615069 RepID=UPI003015683E